MKGYLDIYVVLKTYIPLILKFSTPKAKFFYLDTGLVLCSMMHVLVIQCAAVIERVRAHSNHQDHRVENFGGSNGIAGGIRGSVATGRWRIYSEYY